MAADSVHVEFLRYRKELSMGSGQAVHPGDPPVGAAPEAGGSDLGHSGQQAADDRDARQQPEGGAEGHAEFRQGQEPFEEAEVRQDDAAVEPVQRRDVRAAYGLLENAVSWFTRLKSKNPSRSGSGRVFSR
ncbi:hypothetical protein QRX50_21765 [Amycolatopsis carbonis]|uniref:Uncharacterized protein n=1 Tax=Amycolatopsis carbonis TaxID=715471 RepID=A0A9Y2IN64_9PSEU|nr:hypothetical protein [Amycolatopsis sp. 2-15]WIX83197.1 hypothetical protein QRX50_21765 [Amycolatopsis sp. 2-15]